MLKTRVITAIVLIPLVVLAIFKLPLDYFAAVLLIVIALAAWEWANLSGIKHRLLKGCYVIVVLLLIYCMALLCLSGIGKWRWLGVLLVGLIFYLYLWLGMIAYQRGKHLLGLQCAWVRMLLGLVVLSTSWIAMLVVLGRLHAGRELFMYSLVLVWLADSAAYFGGRLWGKAALADKVSPKKTWEGFWSGTVFALLFALVVSYWLPLTGSSRYYWWFVSLVMVVVSVLGDLSISVLKRIADVKDSGHLIPGHGGILDRVDSLLPMFIVASIALTLWVP